MGWRILQTILLPPIVLGGFFLSSEAGGVIDDVWDGFLGPFLITYWIGLGFLYTWDMVRESVKDASPSAVAGTVAVAMVTLLIVVGPSTLIDDPWLFGVVIAPGIELALPYLRERLHPAMRPVEPEPDPDAPST